MNISNKLESDILEYLELPSEFQCYIKLYTNQHDKSRHVNIAN